MEALIHISDTCQQYIMNNCSTNALTDFAFWTDRNGDELEYWNGQNETAYQQGCACGQEDSCDDFHNKDNICNCDDRDIVNVDEGILTSKDQLPVMKLSYGDSRGRSSWIHYHLGQFSCSGKYGLYPYEIEKSDYNFKVAMTSNKYAIHGTSNLYFQDTVYDYTAGAIDENGWFTAPVDGHYRFELKITIVPNAQTTYNYGSDISVFVDDVVGELNRHIQYISL